MNLRFIATLSVFTGAILPCYREEILGSLLGSLTSATTTATLGWLQLLGLDVLRETSVIYEPGGFAYEIIFKCTGFLPTAFFIVAVLAYTGSPRKKLTGLTFGIPTLLLINQLRLVHLFLVGAVYPQYFHLAHSILWEIAMVLSVLGIWLVWKKWVEQSY